MTILHGLIGADRRHNRIGNTLPEDYIDVPFIKETIVKGCAHCDEKDWHNVGLNRLDDSLPHIKSNCEPCCWECNNKLNYSNLPQKTSKQVYQYTLDDELVKVWTSVSECGRNGFTGVSACCNGKLKTHKGFKWSYQPL